MISPDLPQSGPSLERGLRVTSPKSPEERALLRRNTKELLEGEITPLIFAQVITNLVSINRPVSTKTEYDNAQFAFIMGQRGANYSLLVEHGSDSRATDSNLGMQVGGDRFSIRYHPKLNLDPIQESDNTAWLGSFELEYEKGVGDEGGEIRQIDEPFYDDQPYNVISVTPKVSVKQVLIGALDGGIKV